MHLPFGPSAHWERLRQRARMLAQLREFFAQREFLEVETPTLSADTVIDQHLDPLSVTLFGDPREPHRGPQYWLQTSPEFAMKRLLASGSPNAIYQVARAFRGGERGPLHNPEFTIVEWYRVHDSYQGGMQLLSELAREMLGVVQVDRISYREAFVHHIGLDPFVDPTASLVAFAHRESAATPPVLADDDRDNWLNFLLAEFVEPRLGVDVPAILYDYPATQAALAQVRSEPALDAQRAPVSIRQYAERFELYVRGIELANGYHELLDPEVLRRRIAETNAIRIADGKPSLPESNRLLDAMRHGLPPCTGVALGFDRLVMIACGATTIDEVLAFPIDRA